jgi:ketosteroid isomerase-like protein
VSKENVDLARRALDAVVHGDYEAASRCFHGDAVWHNTREFPGPSKCVGAAEIINFWAALLEPFDAKAPSWTIDGTAGRDEAAVLDVHSVAEGNASGIRLDVHWTAVFQMREGKVARIDVYGDPARARAAAGMEE